METEGGDPEGPDLVAGIAAGEVPEGSLIEGHADGEPVLVTRQQGELYAVGARCPHAGAPLAEGLVVEGTIRCPWHHAAFDLRTGDVVRPPALDGLPCWQVTERAGRIAVTRRRSPAGIAASPVACAAAAAIHGSPRLASAEPDSMTSPPEVEPLGTGAGAPESVVILGGGAAGHAAAETLRRSGYDRPVTIVDAGPLAPYDRTMLSKDYLSGAVSADQLPLRPAGFYEARGIELLLGTEVGAIDPGRRCVQFVDGASRSYGALLIATGAEPVRLGLAARQRVHYLRTPRDARAILDAAQATRQVVVIGAGFLGLEVAAALRTRGLAVTVVAPDARPLERVLGAELGDFVRRVHESHGVAFRLGLTARAIERDGVVLSNGEKLRTDLVVAGVGAQPRTGLAWRAGLAIDRGVMVDRYLETSVPGIYAAGDVARWPDPRTGGRVRSEHWVVAQRHGQTAARNMLAGPLERREPSAAVPFFWSQHYDVTISYTGHAERWDSAAVSGDVEARECSVAYRLGRRTLAVATVGRDRASLAAESIMEDACRLAASWDPAGWYDD